ncbi:hypothetical protein BFL35_04680 [Clavibacter michiganensis]|nr:hypothetical protein BFL35_04680 [Clavibacter michiganensis]
MSIPLEGFSGALPMEICERYAAGMLERERLVDELARYPYLPLDRTDGWDDLMVNPPGTWAEFMLAIDIGLVEDALYEEVFNRKHDVAS